MKCFTDMIDLEQTRSILWNAYVDDLPVLMTLKTLGEQSCEVMNAILVSSKIINRNMVARGPFLLPSTCSSQNDVLSTKQV